MKPILFILCVVCLVNCCFGIDTEKLSRDEVEILYPEKVKEPNFVFNCNSRVELNATTALDVIDIKNLMPKKAKTGYINLALKTADIHGVKATMISMPSVITGEFILEPNNVYHATTDVTVQSGGTLRHMPGAVIKWAANTGLYILGGGNYIARGAPSAMCVNIADIDEPPFGYWKGIQVEGGDAYVSMSEIIYTYVSYAQTGICLRDITLNRACENNFLEYCNQAILTYGIRQTRIANNVLYWNGVGIEVYHESFSGEEDPESVVEIVSNTCYENNYGIDVHGSSSQSLAGVTMIQTNISAASYYYNYLLEAGSGGGYFNVIISDNGRWLSYPGSQNTNGFPEDNPVEVFSNPFVQGNGYFDIVRLDQSCAFVNAASTYISESPYIGFTTSINDVPDVNILDLGFHYPNWDYSSTVRACDFNEDSIVDISDLAKLADYWLFDYNDARQTRLNDYDNSGTIDLGDLLEIAEHWLDPYNFQTFAQFAEQWQKEIDPRFFDSRPDLNKDDIVNFEDFAILASEWQKTGESYPPVTASFSDGQYGGTAVSVSGYDSDIFRIFLFVDGYFVKEIPLGYGSSSSTKEVFMPWLEVGSHEAKIVAFNMQAETICYPPQQIVIDRQISKCIVPSSFNKGAIIPFSVSSTLSDVNVVAICDGEIVWSNTLPANDYIYEEIPFSVTDAYDVDCLQFLPAAPGGAAVMENHFSSPEDIQMRTSSVFGGIVVPIASIMGWLYGYDALVLCPDPDIYHSSCLRPCVTRELEGLGYEVKVMTYNATHRRVMNYNNVQVLCFIGHGHYKVFGDSCWRTTVGLDDGYCVSDKVSNYAPGSAPSWLVSLPASTEATVKTWKEMNFQNLKFATFDCCFGGLLRIHSSGSLVISTANYDIRSDLTMALNLTDEDDYFFSWGNYWNSGCTTEYSKFSCNMWNKLGEGYSLETAIGYAVDEAQTEYMYIEEEGEWQWVDPRDDWRIRGVGYWQDFRL
ncbi:MAG: hypothetical protein JW806_07085 [Sedimentisphaerales bacterium]|nr:hypothetical protein [Sedimentisphaerales bacterium]